MCDEVCRILNISKDEVYTPSSGLIQHMLRWAVMSVNYIALADRYVGEGARGVITVIKKCTFFPLYR